MHGIDHSAFPLALKPVATWPNVKMSNILPFKRKTLKEKHRGKTLCKHGHHKWKVVSNRKFDVKQGKLVTLYRCERCDKEKTELL